MAKGYGQYCPLSLAAELLCRRWTVLVISRLLDGCSRFNEIARGVPRMSPTLLSRRLSELEQAGIVKTRTSRGKAGREYLPTEAGKELEPLLESLAIWGQRWARNMTEDDLDPAFLVWSMHLRINTDTMPPGQTVIEFQFAGAPADSRRFWLIHRSGTVEMCLKDPQLDVDLMVSADLRVFVEAWRGFRDLREEIRAGRITVQGPKNLRERFPGWLRLSSLAPYPRQLPGRERRLSESVR